MSSHRASPDLGTLQRWFHTIITHPASVSDAIDSSSAQALIRMNRAQLESVLRRSKSLTAEQRIGIYANAYYARLLECLRESFPILTRTLGEETFNDFAIEYLQRYPPQSYTLNRLADHFPKFLEETRPDRGADGTHSDISWPDFLIDLAKLEWNIDQIFDAPGIERDKPLSAAEIQSLPPDRWPSVKLMLAPCVRILQFRYPVNSYYTAVRDAKETE